MGGRTQRGRFWFFPQHLRRPRNRRVRKNKPVAMKNPMDAPVSGGATHISKMTGSGRETWETWHLYVAPSGPGSALREEERL